MRFWFCFFFCFLLVFKTIGQISLDHGKNTKPKIIGQQELSMDEDQSFTLHLSHLYVLDADDWLYPSGFTMKIYPGNSYTYNDQVITPLANYYGTLSVPVTVNDGEDDSPKYHVQILVRPINDAPVIKGQSSISTDQNKPVTIQLTYLTVADPDDSYPNDFTLSISQSTSPNYSVSGNQVIPAQNFVGMLWAPVRVYDGSAFSDPYPLEIKVIPANTPPVITNQVPLSTHEDTAIPILLTHLTVSDPDNNTYPNGFTLKIISGSNYSVTENTGIPTTNFYGNLTVSVTVNDGTSDSNIFPLAILVSPVNDPPDLSKIEKETLDYQVGKGPLQISKIAEITDVDDDSLAWAEIGFRQENYRFGQDQLSFQNTSSIRGIFDIQKGVLKISGFAPKSDYVAAIRSIKYNYTTVIEPMLETKILYFILNDGNANSKNAERKIKLLDVVINLDIPTAFTPNGDHANDTWIIKPMKRSEELEKATVRVYNRAGKLVFEGNGLEKEWDGKSNGELLPADTYYYTIDLNLEYSIKSFKGLITILR